MKIENVTLRDISNAYRKVKMYLYGQKTRPKILKLLAFEKNLPLKLQDIFRKFSEGEFDSFINGCSGATMIPSACVQDVNVSFGFQDRGNVVLASNKDNANVYYVEVQADLPIESEIVFALWIMKCGEKLDATLSSDIQGDRLTRDKTGLFNLASPLLYRNYYIDLDSWEKKLLSEAKNLLGKKKDVVLFVFGLLDLSAYVPLDAENCADDWLLRKLTESSGGITNRDSQALTELVCRMLTNWRRTAAKSNGCLPIGCCATGIIQNVFLSQVDSCIKKRIKPLLYSRCGTQAAIVLESGGLGMQSGRDAFNNIILCIDNAVQESIVDGDFIIRKQGKSGQFNIVDKSRARIYHLENSAGTNYLNAFESAVKEDNRKWNELPIFSDTCDEVNRLYTPFFDLRNNKSFLTAGNLAISRRHFAKLLNDMEFFLANLKLRDWSSQRIGFLEMVANSFIDLQSCFRYYTFYPRMLAIAFAASKNEFSSEYKCGKKIISQIFHRINELVSKQLQSAGEVMSKTEQVQFSAMLKESFVQTLVDYMVSTVQDDEVLKVLMSDLFNSFDEFSKFRDQEFPSYMQIQNADLANVSLKELVLDRCCNGRYLRNSKLPRYNREYEGLMPENAVRALNGLWAKCAIGAKKSNFPLAFYFATRPWNITDIYALWNWSDALSSCKEIKSALYYLGWGDISRDLPVEMPSERGEHNDVCNQVIRVHSDSVPTKVRIGLVSWFVDSDSWIAMVKGMVDPLGADRYRRWMGIINDVLKLDDKSRPNYLVFPELAISPKLFIYAARKLARFNISLIAGVDYVREVGDSGKLACGAKLQNQVWASLVYDGCGQLPIIAKYTKSAFAQHEEATMFQVAGIDISCTAKQSYNNSIIMHGNNHSNICLSVLICSDLLDIEARKRLRGRIDVLFVPAWNKDVSTYAALVEATSYDIHAYVALCNSREYGDTRLRAPAKEKYARDVIVLKGGIADFFAIGELDVERLRKFQSCHRSPDKWFKPVPTGFKIVECRRALPAIAE